MDSGRRTKTKGTSGDRRTVIGTGLIALDVVIADSFQIDPILCAGGTCGNVLTALSFLGWNAYPIGRLRPDAASKRVMEDLKHWGVKLDFVELGDEGSTPVVVQHIRRNKAGEPSHSFSRKCPKCGTWLPWYKAVRAADVSSIASRLPDGDIFYFDRTSRGAIELARNANQRGCMVVFEPSSASEPALLAEALQIAHIVKIASDRRDGNEGVLDAESPLLLIETLGADGLRFKQRGKKGTGRWKKIPAFKASVVTDTAGAGDWCTVGIISRLGPLGVGGLRAADSDTVTAALKVGQAMAAWACQFHGARGGLYQTSKDNFVKAIKCMLEGDGMTISITPKPGRASRSPVPVWCDHCVVTKSRKLARG